MNPVLPETPVETQLTDSNRVADTVAQAGIQGDVLLDMLAFLNVPAGEAVIGMEADTAERLIRAYSKDGGNWSAFYGRELPLHTVGIAAFDLARVPVTNRIYAQFMTDGAYLDPRFWTPDGWAWVTQTNRLAPYRWNESGFNGLDQPVVGLSWYEAAAVAQWAAIRTGKPTRLPNEVEWEWAARGANPKNLYPWGVVMDVTRLNSGVPSDAHPPKGKTVPVGSYSPHGDGAFGHADMLGQTWEWTSTQFKPYPYSREDLREDIYAPERRVLRGGNWADGKYNNRVTARYQYMPTYSDMTTGVRLAMGAPAPSARPPYDLVIYGKTTFCPDLENTRRWLHSWRVPYRQISYDLDEQAALRLDSWLGSRTVPTLVIANYGEVTPIHPPLDADLKHLRNTDRGSILHEPEEATLRAFLVRHGFLNG